MLLFRLSPFAPNDRCVIYIYILRDNFSLGQLILIIILIIALVIIATRNLYNKIPPKVVINEECLHMDFISMFWVHDAISLTICAVVVLLHHFIININMSACLIATLKRLDGLA